MNKNLITVLVIILIILAATAIYFALPKNNKMTETPDQNSQVQQPAQENQQETNSTNFNIQGMKVEIVKQGTGEAAKTGDTVTVNYTGSLTNGTKFDSSVDPAFQHVTPFQFKLGQNGVIQGWELGVLGMKVGEKRKLTIPPELAYGNQAVGSAIPANSTLVFEIDLLRINK